MVLGGQPPGRVGRRRIFSRAAESGPSFYLHSLVVSQFHFRPDDYLKDIRADVPRFDDFQKAVAEATRGVEARAILELGTGTGETARRVLELHPDAALVGIDESEEMLERARGVLPANTTLFVARLQDPLPDGPFDVVFSALTVHHLHAGEKVDLFRQVAGVLRPGGRFVLGDVVVPQRAEDAVTPLTEGFDLPDRVDEQLEWLAAAGFRATTTWTWKDLAVISAQL
jgi:tRNA (cmo5U34)-methyltransferase